MKENVTVLKHHVATVAQMESPKWLIQKDLIVLVENSVVVIEISNQLKPIVLIWIVQIVQNVKSQPSDVVMLHSNSKIKVVMTIPVVHTQLTDVAQTEKPPKKTKLEATVQDLPPFILVNKMNGDAAQIMSTLKNQLKTYIVVIFPDSDVVLIMLHQKKTN